MSNKKKQNKAILRRYEAEHIPQRSLHAALFPEEYDFHYDSNVEIKARARGENPMSEAYQLEVNLRRFEMGVEPFEGNIGIENTEGLISSQEYYLRRLKEESIAQASVNLAVNENYPNCDKEKDGE